jgi:hypothetical protein
VIGALYMIGGGGQSNLHPHCLAILSMVFVLYIFCIIKKTVSPEYVSDRRRGT